MVKVVAIVMLASVILMLLLTIALSLKSQQQPALGLRDGRLAICPSKPNCICSETVVVSDRSDVAPIDIRSKNSVQAWRVLNLTVERLGGEIVKSEDDYLHAIFTSTVFRFVDDLEARLDAADGVIHLRSASRVGHSDFGVNRKRVERLKAEWLQIIEQ